MSFLEDHHFSNTHEYSLHIYLQNCRKCFVITERESFLQEEKQPAFDVTLFLSKNALTIWVATQMVMWIILKSFNLSGAFNWPGNSAVTRHETL